MKFLLVLLLSISFSLSAFASETEGMSWTQKWKYNLKQTLNSSTYDFYLPFYAWHNRLTYDREHIDKYNENTWGAGLGLSRTDSDGDSHLLYAMAFEDSNDYLETFYGYAFLKNYYFEAVEGLRAGIGFTLGLTQRHEYDYIPVPLPLPIAGIGYKRFDLQAAYVPGVKNDGNVLFVWVKWRIN